MNLLNIPLEKRLSEGYYYCKLIKNGGIFRYYWFPRGRLFFVGYDCEEYYKIRTIPLPPRYLAYMLLKYP